MKSPNIKYQVSEGKEKNEKIKTHRIPSLLLSKARNRWPWNKSKRFNVMFNPIAADRATMSSNKNWRYEFSSCNLNTITKLHLEVWIKCHKDHKHKPFGVSRQTSLMKRLPYGVLVSSHLCFLDPWTSGICYITKAGRG